MNIHSTDRRERKRNSSVPFVLNILCIQIYRYNKISYNAILSGISQWKRGLMPLKQTVLPPSCCIQGGASITAPPINNRRSKLGGSCPCRDNVAGSIDGVCTCVAGQHQSIIHRSKTHSSCVCTIIARECSLVG